MLHEMRLWSRRIGRPLLAGSVAGALVAPSIIGALEVSAPAPRGPGERSEAAVNRTMKGDRSIATRMIRTIRFHQVDARNAPIVDVELAAGCEAFVSPLADVRLAHVARQCVS